MIRSLFLVPCPDGGGTAVGQASVLGVKGQNPVAMIYVRQKWVSHCVVLRDNGLFWYIYAWIRILEWKVKIFHQEAECIAMHGFFYR